MQRSGIDKIKYHTWPRIPMGKWQTHSRHHKREPRGHPFPAGDHKAHINIRAQRHSKHKTEQKHKRSSKEVPPWNGLILIDDSTPSPTHTLTITLMLTQTLMTKYLTLTPKT